jgi:hypothetical protein
VGGSGLVHAGRSGVSQLPVSAVSLVVAS